MGESVNDGCKVVGWVYPVNDELSALRALRDAVGKYIDDCSEDIGTWSEVIAAYEKAKEARDGK